jgi:hypothetical protein
MTVSVIPGTIQCTVGPSCDVSGINEELTQETDKVVIEMVSSSWCGVLAALSLLLDASYGQPAVQTSVGILTNMYIVDWRSKQLNLC